MEEKTKKTAPKAEKKDKPEKKAGMSEVEACKTELAKALKELDAAKKAAETAQKELAEQKEKYLRMLAEYDNYRKRTGKEKDTAYADGLADAVAEMLPVIDNLARAAAVEDPGKIAEGLALTLKGANAALAALKVEETAKAGDTFDPTLHNAVMHVEDEAFGEGEITEVFQKGYRRADKVIRDAMVKVAN